MPQKFSGWRAKLPCISEHRRNLSAYLDGELDRSLRASLEDHLDMCQRCRASLEQLRFASRAMSHFVVPQARVPSRQFWEQHSQRTSHFGAALERFWTMKISVPAPIAAGAFAFIILFTVFALGQLRQSRSSAASLTTSVQATQTKIVEVPVEREVLRERIVTRTVYVREPRSSVATRTGSQANRPQREWLMAERTPLEGRATGNKVLFTPASLAGFRPATDANLRIVKEPEQ
jgi:anti-sigma factor RsiW